MIGKRISDSFGEPGKFTYWYVPPNLRDVIGLRDGDVGRIIDTSRPHNLNTFARGLAKIAYCNVVMKYGLDGFRPLVTPDIILGRFPNIAYFVGSDPTPPSPPYRRGVQHSVGLGSITVSNTKFLTASIRLFGDSGANDKGTLSFMVRKANIGLSQSSARQDCLVKYSFDTGPDLASPDHLDDQTPRRPQGNAWRDCALLQCQPLDDFEGDGIDLLHNRHATLSSML
jgi:hypothetical protein